MPDPVHLGDRQVEPVGIHDLGPCRYEIRDEGATAIGLCVGFGNRPQFDIIEDYEAQGGTVDFVSDYEVIDGVTYLTVEFTLNDLDLDILNSTTEFLGIYRVAQ